jgi:nucleotide-binding universal stress UspA family protein
VNIKSMLLRLQTALNRDGLVEELILGHGSLSPDSADSLSAETINLVVGYNSSPNSHAALDLTLWIAHQTRLATGRQVVVQVVYVLEDATWSHLNHDFRRGDFHPVECPDRLRERSRLEPARLAARCALLPVSGPTESPEPFSYADQVLWQARCLANEWRGSLETHLRFGTVADELRTVVEAETAALLILGCKSRQHPLLQQLGQPFLCPILGIPSCGSEP